ncbi:MAG: Rab family GTPase [Candidatus Atabeyarchaeum deiterrae]
MIKKNVFKIIIVGEGGVGKTSLVKRHVDESFKEDMKMTIGVDLSVKRMRVNDEERMLQIWDLGGQPHFKSVADLYFKGAHGMMSVFDVTRRASMDRLVDWIDRVYATVGQIPMVVVGNKVDLRNPGEGIAGVSKEEGREFATRYQSPYLETSAKDGSGVDAAFQDLVSTLCRESQSIKPP